MLRITTYPHFINHSDRDVVVPKHTYVGAMEKVQESGRDNLSTIATPEPVSQHALSECLTHSACCPANGNWCIPSFKKTQVSLDPVLLISPVPHLYNITLTLVILNPSSKDWTSSNLLNRKLTLKLTPSKHLANTHYMPSSNSTIIIPKSGVYRPCQLLLNKKACWMIALMLTIVIILTAVASHTHCHFNPPFKKQNKPFVSSERNLTWKQLLNYGTTVRLKIRLQAARLEKTGQLYFLDWTLPPVLTKRLHISITLLLVSMTPYLLKTPPWSKQSPTLTATLLSTLVSAPAPIQSHECLPIPYTATSLTYTFHC